MPLYILSSSFPSSSLFISNRFSKIAWASWFFSVSISYKIWQIKRIVVRSKNFILNGNGCTYNCGSCTLIRRASWHCRFIWFITNCEFLIIFWWICFIVKILIFLKFFGVLNVWVRFFAVLYFSNNRLVLVRFIFLCNMKLKFISFRPQVFSEPSSESEVGLFRLALFLTTRFLKIKVQFSPGTVSDIFV